MKNDTMFSHNKRAIILFSISFICSLIILIIGNTIWNISVHQKMISYSNRSFRDSDHAMNQIVLNGRAGYVGETNVYVKYLEDGFIHVSGDNSEDNRGWKLISELQLLPGTYTLTGLKGVPMNTVAIQLYYIDDTGFSRFVYQWEEDVVFRVDKISRADVHIYVNPSSGYVDAVARPALYKDEK